MKRLGHQFPPGVEGGGWWGVLPCMLFLGMCGSKVYGFSAVLVINRVLILAILVINRVNFWSSHK